MHRFPGRSTVSLSLTLVFVVLTTGFAHERSADHDGGEAHVERAHGGHSHVLLDDEPQLRPDRVSPPAAAIVVTVSIDRLSIAPVVSHVASFDLEPHGRDPPVHPLGPRAPPTHLT